MKYGKLVLSIALDLVGMASYFFPGIGETADFVWAPISGFLITRMYPDRAGRIGGFIGFLEELIPGMDFIPTFTLMWVYVHLLKKDKYLKKRAT
ncbi:hypothetical protein [Robertkochia sediminum]|uniref:hypothetical protein n=1 Tax=Robertkochia sediminum TaxID=2785326 RepID=UPI001931420C|nr:hypothetical protein [Robertkochia sediminum]MBL7473470.1 hypothetical protein [Robertkochia sediminum]